MNAPFVGVVDRPPGVVAPARPSLRGAVVGVIQTIVFLAFALGVALGGYATRASWLPILFPVPSATESAAEGANEPAPVSEQVMLSPQAQKNLKLTSKPFQLETFWKTISVPGIVIDRPGFSDQGVVSPATGVVSRIHKIAGNTAKPGEPLFTIKLLSESLYLTQSELFKSTQDIKLAEVQKERLVASSGAVPESRVIEVSNQITRLQVAGKAYRQELLNRGLLPEQIDRAAEGKFVTEITIRVPDRQQVATLPLSASQAPAESMTFEVEELKVELGQQVQAGQTLCLLANHQMLAIEGQAFRDESPLLERVVKEGWPIEVDFDEEASHGWMPLGQTFRVTYIANTIDPQSRTFRFLMPLENQSRVVEQFGKSQMLWRFRPGQRVRLQVRVEAVPNVFVVPTAAVAREGANAYVFRQNGDVFDRKPVQVVHHDRNQVVLANDGSVPPGIYVAQTGAAQLNRMIKSQSGTTPKGMHVHADGSVHMADH